MAQAAPGRKKDPESRGGTGPGVGGGEPPETQVAGGAPESLKEPMILQLVGPFKAGRGERASSSLVLSLFTPQGWFFDCCASEHLHMNATQGDNSYLSGPELEED